MLELYGAICASLGTRVEPEIQSRAAGEITEQYLDASRARELLGWKARVSLDDGLDRTVEWYRRLLLP